MDPASSNIRFDYLAPRNSRWGLHLCGVGTRVSPPHAPYQVHESGAPYQWNKGRILRDYSLLYLTRGTGIVRFRGSPPLPIKAGNVLLIVPGLWHDYTPDPETGWEEYWIMFNGPQAGPLVSELGFPKRVPLASLGIDDDFRLLFTRMLEVAGKHLPFAEAVHTGLLLQLLAAAQSSVQLRKDQGDRKESFVQQARKRMANTPEKSFDMKSLARELGVSYPHFRRVFKASAGIPPQQYLLDQRIIMAKRLLETPGIKLAEIARRAGFNDPYYFSRLFKSRTGIAPSLWRQ